MDPSLTLNALSAGLRIYPYLPTPAQAGYDTRAIFKCSLTGMNSEFTFSLTSCLTKAEELSLPYYLPIAGGRIIGFIPFPRVLVLCEMQPATSRIWTHITMFISYDDNHYTMGIYWLYPPQMRIPTPCQKKRSVLGMTLNCIEWWKPDSGDLENVESSKFYSGLERSHLKVKKICLNNKSYLIQYHINVCKNFLRNIAQSAWAVKYTDCTSAER